MDTHRLTILGGLVQGAPDLFLCISLRPCRRKNLPFGGLKVKLLEFHGRKTPRPALLSLTTICHYMPLSLLWKTWYVVLYQIQPTAYVLYSFLTTVRFPGISIPSCTDSFLKHPRLQKPWQTFCIDWMDGVLHVLLYWLVCWVLDYGRCDTSATIKTHQQNKQPTQTQHVSPETKLMFKLHWLLDYYHPWIN